MDEREAVTLLRSAIVRGAHEELVALLRDRPWPAYSLQLIGDGVRDAVHATTDGADDVARACRAELQERGWEGDRELLYALAAARGEAPTPMLRPLAVDLEELSMILEGDPLQGGGRIDLQSGEVWPQSAIEYGVEAGEIDEDDDDDPERWLWVDSEGSRPGYRDMEWFIADLAERGEDGLARRLDRAIAGRGAFRRFKNLLDGHPGPMTRWHSFSNDRQRGRARSWLAAQGYAVARPSGSAD